MGANVGKFLKIRKETKGGLKVMLSEGNEEGKRTYMT